MIAAAKDWAKRHWPRLRLRTILFATLFVVAALPGMGAVFLRVYENTLVRQTEAELVAQGAALSATATAMWPGPASVGRGDLPARSSPDEGTGIDLSTAPIRAERPEPAASGPPAADAVLAARRIGRVLADTSATTFASIILLDRYGRIVTGTAARGSYAALPEVAAALGGRAITVLRRNGAYRATYRFEWLSRAAALRVHHARPIVVDGRVVGVLLLSRSARGLFRGLYEDRGKIMLGVGVIFLLLVLLSEVISRGVTRPIEQLGVATRAVANGGGQVPGPPPTAAIEIQGLYADFAAMAAAIERRSRYLRDFAHAVSHEFKTPLAGIRGAVELLGDHPDMSAADRRRFLANADADATRLASLVTRLLDLARADMAAPGEGSSDAAAIVRQVADAWRSMGVTVDVELPTRLPLAAVSAGTVESVLATLFENSRQAGASAVRVRGTVDDDSVVIRVVDNGSGVAAADRLRIFEPFFTTRRAQGGTGLGLPIARSLLEAAGGTLTLEIGEPVGFHVRMPRA